MRCCTIGNYIGLITLAVQLPDRFQSSLILDILVCILTVVVKDELSDCSLSRILIPKFKN